jgi:DNA-binding MarR family transcriptional regulator
MTTVTLNPQVLGQAEKAHQAMLEHITSGTGITYHQFVALTMTGASGGLVGRDQLVGQLVGALKIDRVAAGTIIADLAAAGLLQDLPNEVAFTEAGQTRYRQLRAAVDDVVGRVYGDLPAEDLATAGQVLTTITTRLNAELANK